MGVVHKFELGRESEVSADVEHYCIGSFEELFDVLQGFVFCLLHHIRHTINFDYRIRRDCILMLK